MDSAELTHRFEFHPATDDRTRNAHQDVRDMHLALARSLHKLLPEGREKSLAMTHLEESMMWSNAAIARAR